MWQVWCGLALVAFGLYVVKGCGVHFFNGMPFAIVGFTFAVSGVSGVLGRDLLYMKLGQLSLESSDVSLPSGLPGGFSKECLWCFFFLWHVVCHVLRSQSVCC